jgi:hypothetical protein
MGNLRKLKTLIFILLALLVVLGIVLVAKYIEKVKKQKELDKNSIHLGLSTDVREFSIEGKDGSLTQLHLDTHGQITSVSHDGTDYVKEKLNLTEAQKVLETTLFFQINKSFDASSQNISDYGLSPSEYKVTIEKLDGTKTILSLGALTSGRTGVYAKVEGDDRILVADYTLYQVLSMPFENYLSSYIFFMTKEDVEEVSFIRRSNGDAWTVKSVEDNEESVILEQKYEATYPMKREATEKLVDLLNAIYMLQATQYVPIAKEDMASYGLDEPEYTFTIKLLDGQTHELFLSKELGGFYYGYTSSNPYTFKVDVQMIPGLNLSSFDLIDSKVVHAGLEEVRTINFKVKDKEFNLECNVAESMDFMDQYTTITLDGRNAKVFDSNGECYGTLLFGAVVDMKVSRVDYSATPELKNEVATIRVNYTDGDVLELKLVPLSQEEYYCFINGFYSGFILDRSVLYKDNGRAMTGFGIWDAYLLINEAIDNKDVDDIYDRP